MRILVFMASTSERPDAHVGMEAREIRASLRGARFGERFSVHLEPAARLVEVERGLREYRPHVVHFCGHGDEERLFLLDDEGDALPVDPAALAGLVARVAGPELRLVVLNACRSLAHARALVDEGVALAMGMAAPLGGRAAVELAASLYGALGAGETVGDAYEQAVAGMRARGALVDEIPVLCSRRAADDDSDDSGQEVDARAVRLVGETGSPDAQQPEQRSKPGSTARRRTTRWLIGVLVVFLLLVLGLLLFWPRLSVPTFPDDAGVVVARSWLADGETRAAHAHLVRELENLGEIYVHAVELPLRGWNDGELVRAARAAGGSLVVVVESGPRLRVLAVPGRHGEPWTADIPSLSIGRAKTRAQVAPVLFALAWSAGKAPGASALDRPVAIPPPEHVGPHLTVLAVLLGYLTTSDAVAEDWRAQARDALAGIVTQCASPAGAERAQDRTCALAGYLYYALLCPRCPGAAERLEEIRASGPALIGDAALERLLVARCQTDPDWVADQLHDWMAAAPHGHCARLAMAVPAACLVYEHERTEVWLSALAEPELDVYAGCGEMRAKVLAGRAWHEGRAGRWAEAAADYERAAALAPHNPIHRLDLVAALLQQEPRPAHARDRIDEILDVEHLPPTHRLHGAFLWWLANHGPSHSEPDAARVRELLCDGYGELSSGARAIPELGPLGERVCRAPAAPACRVYRILTGAQTRASADELCAILR